MVAATSREPRRPRRRPRTSPAREPRGPTDVRAELLPTEVTTVVLSRRLDALEHDLRHAWASFLELSSPTAERVGAAGRLVHQAKTLLDDTSLIR
jgi:hypothetical protein